MKLKKFFLGFALLSLLFTSCNKEVKTATTSKKRAQLWQSKTPAGWQDVRRVVYEYNENGLLVEERAERIVSKDSIINQYRIRSSYDKQGRELTKRREQWNVNHWIFAIESSFKYEGDKIVRRIDSIARGRGDVIDLVDYEYDEKGFLVAEITYDKRDSLKASPRKVVYTNNENGDPTIKEFPVFRNSEWVKARKMTLTYDENGHHIATTRFNWRNNQWNMFVDYDLTIDADGKRLSELWKRPTPQGNEEFMRVVYEYK